MVVSFCSAPTRREQPARSLLAGVHQDYVDASIDGIGETHDKKLGICRADYAGDKPEPTDLEIRYVRHAS